MNPAAHPDHSPASKGTARDGVVHEGIVNEGIVNTGTDGVVLIRDANTTIGYCRHTEHGDIEYIYVNPAFRGRGFGRRLLDEVARRTGRRGAPQPPLSPLGRRFFKLDLPAREQQPASPD